MALHTLKKSKKRSKQARIRRCKNVLAQLARELERVQKLPPQSLLKSSELKPRMLTPEQASQLLGLSVKTLANLRSSGGANLPYRRIGSRIFYRRCDVLKYRKARKFYSTSEYPQAREGGVQ